MITISFPAVIQLLSYHLLMQKKHVP